MCCSVYADHDSRTRDWRLAKCPHSREHPDAGCRRSRFEKIPAFHLSAPAMRLQKSCACVVIVATTGIRRKEKSVPYPLAGDSLRSAVIGSTVVGRHAALEVEGIVFRSCVHVGDPNNRKKVWKTTRRDSRN